MENGDGGNAELNEIVEDRGLDRCRKHFRFSLPESHAARIADETIVERDRTGSRSCISAGSAASAETGREAPRGSGAGYMDSSILGSSQRLAALIQTPISSRNSGSSSLMWKV